MPAKRGGVPIAPTQPATDVAVIGGGVIGLAIAWRARARGLGVTVFDRREPGSGASNVAAGMLAPVTEAEAGERALLGLGMESARRWPAFAAELRDVTGVDVGYRACGTLVVARDGDEAEALDREVALRERLGLRTACLLPSEARRLDPALAPSVRLALDVPDDHAVDPRLLAAALLLAARQAGAVLRAGAGVRGVVCEGERVTGVALEDGSIVQAGQVVVAAGAWSGLLEGVPASARVPVRPVKGQTLRLLDPGGPGLLGRVLRFEGGYVVPRGDGRYVLGATVEERGFDTAMTAGAAYELLRDASELVPGILELEIEELVAGLRPGTPDNGPVLGAAPGVAGLVWATGHYRNGILLTPVTADLIAAELAGEPAEHAFGPGRFPPPSPAPGPAAVAAP
jgi:glycine oxidase